MKKTVYELPTPAVVVDLDVVRRNIDVMLEGARANGLAHRPHVKTHRCSELALMQVKAGCQGITAAKLGEAEVMADAGIDDIFVAYSIIGQDKVERLLKLARRCRVLRTAVNSETGAKALSQAFAAQGLRLDVLVEIDGGLNRGGVRPGIPALKFARKIRELPGIHIVGLMYYGGLVYDSHNREEIEGYAQKGRQQILDTADLLRADGFDMEVLSAGSSFTGKTPEALQGITEIRSGHYIFNDCGQLDVGLAAPEDCALRVIATVVCKPDEHTVIADVGTKNLTSDQCHHRTGYGYIVGHEEIEIYALNEEHAFLRAKENISLEIGDKIQIIPNHACVVTNLADEVYGFSKGEFDHMLCIDARGKSV